MRGVLYRSPNTNTHTHTYAPDTGLGTVTSHRTVDKEIYSLSKMVTSVLSEASWRAIRVPALWYQHGVSRPLYLQSEPAYDPLRSTNNVLP